METYICLPNLLAGGLPAGVLPGLALAADKRAQHMRTTQKSKHNTCATQRETHTRHTKRDAWMNHTRELDMTKAREMGGRRASRAPPPISQEAVISPVYIHACVLCSFVWRACAVLFCQLHMQAPDRAAHLQASPQPRD